MGGGEKGNLVSPARFHTHTRENCKWMWSHTLVGTHTHILSTTCVRSNYVINIYIPKIYVWTTLNIFTVSHELMLTLQHKYCMEIWTQSSLPLSKELAMNWCWLCNTINTVWKFEHNPPTPRPSQGCGVWTSRLPGVWQFFVVWWVCVYTNNHVYVYVICTYFLFMLP